eukprot:11721398-Ditylum_brightwellii.AAC.1
MSFLTYYDAMHKDDYVQQELMQQPLAYLLQSDLDMMHFHQAMKKPDKEEFVKAIVSEVNTYTEQKYWKLVPCNKARVNVHGRHQPKGVNYWKTYVPV